MDEDSRHELRIRLKRLGSGAEFFRGLYPVAAVRAHLEAMEPLRHLLGELNDLAVARRTIRALSEDADRPARETAREMLDRLDRRARQRLPALTEAWERFDKAPVFWRT
jgi:CHAD domain-containing protein